MQVAALHSVQTPVLKQSATYCHTRPFCDQASSTTHLRERRGLSERAKRKAQARLAETRDTRRTHTRAALKQAPTVGADYFTSDTRPVILFDGVCNLCNGAVNFLLDWDTKAQYRLAALQSKAGSELLQQAGRKPNDLSSVVLVEPGQAYVKSEAVFRIGRRLNTPFFVLGSLGLPIPSLLRDAAYDLVANTRYQVFGKTNSCRMCNPAFRERFIDS